LSIVAMSRRRLALGLGLVGLLAHCGDTPPPRLFTLSARGAAPMGEASLTIMITQLTLPKYLDRPEIVRYGSAYELRLSEFERWGEEMNEMVTRTIMENLALRLPRAQIFTAHGLAASPVDATVDIDIGRFDAGADGVVVLAARWIVRRERRPADFQTARLMMQPASPSTVDLVAAMSDVLGQFADILVTRAQSVLEAA
jgi:uncharacterized lipoprotein YmbA